MMRRAAAILRRRQNPPHKSVIVTADACRTAHDYEQKIICSVEEWLAHDGTRRCSRDLFGVLPHGCALDGMRPWPGVLLARSLKDGMDACQRQKFTRANFLRVANSVCRRRSRNLGKLPVITFTRVNELNDMPLCWAISGAAALCARQQFLLVKLRPRT